MRCARPAVASAAARSCARRLKRRGRSKRPLGLPSGARESLNSRVEGPEVQRSWHVIRSSRSTKSPGTSATRSRWIAYRSTSRAPRCSASSVRTGPGRRRRSRCSRRSSPPTSGRATVLGHDLKSEGRKIRAQIGVVQQQDSFDQGLNVETSMDLYGLIWNVPKAERPRRIDELIGHFEMQEFRKMPTVDLSGGQRRRLQVAREFIHDMDLLFLDEPTVGFDPIVRRSVLDYLKERVRQGLTIFFTTHILEQAEYLCNRIAVINQSRIVQIDTPENLKRRFGSAKAVEFKDRKSIV